MDMKMNIDHRDFSWPDGDGAGDLTIVQNRVFGVGSCLTIELPDFEEFHLSQEGESALRQFLNDRHDEREGCPNLSGLDIIFEPFTTIVRAFRSLYPEATVPPIWVQPLPDTEGPTKPLGGLIYPESGNPPFIAIAPDLAILAAGDILCHELAHVVTSPCYQDDEAAHGPEWQAAYAAIVEEYERLLGEDGAEVVEVKLSSKRVQL